MPMLMGQLRYALWRGDREEARRVTAMFGTLPGAGPERMMALARVGTGDLEPTVIASELHELTAWISNPRFTSMLLQYATELFAAGGAHDIALDCLRRASEGVLVDLEWVRGCPLLEPLRGSPGYAQALAIVEKRASELWRR
jgi:hypothetical protein